MMTKIFLHLVNFLNCDMLISVGKIVKNSVAMPWKGHHLMRWLLFYLQSVKIIFFLPCVLPTWPNLSCLMLTTNLMVRKTMYLHLAVTLQQLWFWHFLVLHVFWLACLTSQHSAFLKGTWCHAETAHTNMMQTSVSRVQCVISRLSIFSEWWWSTERAGLLVSNSWPPGSAASIINSRQDIMEGSDDSLAHK